MREGGNSPMRSRIFRLTTIAAAGLGGFMVGLWAIRTGFGGGVAGLSVEVAGGIIAALCALAASVAAMSFFAGVDESASYVYRETQFDKLTGLYSRGAMSDRIAEAAAQTARTGKPVFLLDIDIDRFRQLNDNIGYGEADRLVAAVARRLREVLPADAEIGRINAGEFAVLLPDAPRITVMDDVLGALIDKLAQPYQLPSHLQSVNLSVGVAAIPKDGTDPAALLRRANLALQHARASGVGNWSAFHAEMGRVAEYRQWIESELHVAFRRGDFEVHYQPQLDLSTGRVVGYEALMRWRHPERGMVPPGEFVPVAEETGMIVPMGEWVLRKACEDARLLPPDCAVAVNISPVQFMARDFLSLVRDIIASTGIAPGRLELEVTETAMMQDRELAGRILDALSKMGISVAVDDFGTGYSNLSYLVDFPFKKLKIDQSFVRRLEKDNNSGAVVSTIVGLSRALGVRTIAEGVETESQATLLKAAGCQVGQGYLFGRPGPLVMREGRLEHRREAAVAAH
jgi:diguanylate cyclase (GGDEF)-like protein